MRSYLVVILILVCIAFPAQGESQPLFVVDSLKDEYPTLNDFLLVLKDAPGSMTIETVRSSSNDSLFKPYSLSILDDRRSVFWGKIRIQNHLSEPGLLTDWILLIGEGSYVDVYVYDQNDKLLSQEITGQLVPASRKRLKVGNKRERIYFSLPPKETLTVYIRLHSVTGHKPQFKLSLNKEDFPKHLNYQEKRQSDSLFLGFILTMMGFNLLFFYVTRDKSFLYQAIFLGGVTVFMLDPMNILCDVIFFNNHPWFHQPAVYTAIFILNIAYLQFIRIYTNLKLLLPKWDRVLKWLIIVNIVFLPLVIAYYFFTLNEIICSQFLALLVGLQYSTLLGLTPFLYQTKDKKVYFIIAATLVLIFGVYVVGLNVFLGYGVKEGFSKIILGANISLFFMGLAYRMKTLQTERLKAQRLKDLNDLKTRLYTNLTHEFRTPLTVILGMTEQIRKHPRLGEDSAAKKALSLIRNNGENLLQLVNRLLEMAKLESGSAGLNLSNGDIIAFINFQVSTFEQFTESKNIELQYFSELLKLETAFDSQKLQQIITNLVANAIKFTPEKGKINVSVRKGIWQERDVLEIKVADNGIGISKEDLPLVFDRFYQVEQSKKQGQGTGIGLALTQELVNLHGGKIDVESTLGIGSTFTVILPIMEMNSDAPPLENTTVRPGQISTMTGTEFHPDLAHPLEEESKNELPLLLLVEDNQDIIYYLRTLLSTEYEIETANNGQKGYALALESIPDIIISDVMMPEMDGIELCEKLKTDYRTDHIPIILLTAKTTDADRISGLQHGADVYLTKPFHQEELFAHLGNLLKLRQKLHSHFAESYFANPLELPENNSEQKFINKLSNLVEQNLGNETFGIQELCAAFCLSRSQLHRKLRALTNKSTSQFLRSIRLQKAKHLLKQQHEVTISEIAYATGFSDPAYFTKSFIEEFGINPTTFRNKQLSHE